MLETMQTAAELQCRSVELITQSWTGLRQLLSEQAHVPSAFKSTCEEIVTAACAALEAKSLSGYMLVHEAGKVFVVLEACGHGDQPVTELQQVLSDRYAAAALVREKRAPSALLAGVVKVLETMTAPACTLQALMSEVMRLQLLKLGDNTTDTPFIDLLDDSSAVKAKASSDGGANAEILEALSTTSLGDIVQHIGRVVGDVARCFRITKEQTYAKMFDANLDKIWAGLVGVRVYGNADASLARWRTCIGIIADDDCVRKSVVALLVFFFYYKEILVGKGRGDGMQGCDKIRRWALNKAKAGEIVPNIFKQ
jgi:hypothetical protein